MTMNCSLPFPERADSIRLGWVQTKKKLMAQLGVEPRSLPLCLNSAGHYIARVIPLDHCASLDTNTVTRPYLS